MTFDNLRQDLRLAVRSLLRAPAFAAVTILTLALGIGANTAIFSIVNGVILRPLGYPKPEQLMYLTTQFPAFGFDQFWVSPPEYFEFRELNQSFAAVGAYTTGEVNLTAGDRPLRVRSASVDDESAHRARRAAAGRPPVREGRDRRRAAAEPDRAPVPLPPICILSYELWQIGVRRQHQHHRPDGRGQRPAPRSDRHHAAGRRRDGQPHRDLDAARAQSRQPAESRQPLPLSDRPLEGRRHDAAGARAS